MQIILNIPKEFEEHYNKDRFKDSLSRVVFDIRSRNFEGVSGNYDVEVLEMLIKVLDRSILSSHAAKLIMNSVYGQSAIYADTDKGLMKEGSDTNVPATRNYKRITDTQLEEVRVWLIDNVMEDAEIMFSDDIRNAKPDLVEVVASLYELLHREVTGQSYLYMFHWANKIGSWVENERIFTDMIERADKMKLDEIKKDT